MAATFTTSGVFADASIEGRGKGTAGSWAGGEGGQSTGIGIGAQRSGVSQSNFTATVADALPVRIGGGVKSSAGSSNSDSNLGNVITAPATFVAGSGYTDGVHLARTAGGGAVGAGEIQITVAGGAITAVDITDAGSSFTSTPTVALPPSMGAGTGGSVTLTTGPQGRAAMLGTGYGTNKGTRYLVAAGAVANNAAVSGGYLNRSGRAMIAGEGVWAVAP
jgi:hypothetical protein